jgi:glycerol 2-dehydrogenase (NADP+)
MYDKQGVKSIGEVLNISSAQVVLSWAVQRETIVVPKSEDEGRMTANISVRIPIAPSRS